MSKTIKVLSLCLLIFFVANCSKSIPKFNPNKAFQYLEKQCSFGPRNPNSTGHRECKEYLISFLEDNGAEVETQNFQDTVRNEVYDLTNIIGKYYPNRINRIILGAHWDTRPWANLDSIESNRNKPIMGANDAASGVAVLLELARIINLHDPLPYGIDIVLFDGEDAGVAGSNQDWCLGSKYFVNNYDLNPEPKSIIIVDMVGDKDLEIKIERYSYQNSPELVTKIWKIAQSLEIDEFKTRVGQYIYDDHYPFIENGYKAIDIIDFDYPYWHTTHDTKDKCSAESLEKVGKVLTHYIFSE